MKFYADQTGRRTAQVLSDLLALVWVAFWLYAGRIVYDQITAMGDSADQLRATGGTLRDGMTSAGEAVKGLPFIGNELVAPFQQAAAAGRSIAQFGTDLGVAVDRLAVVMSLATALVPIALVLGTWAILRIRFVRRATASARFLDTQPDLDLFALRALSRQPMRRLARIDTDPMAAWRRRDPYVTRELAQLELRSCGVNLPAHVAQPAPQPS